MLFPVPTPRAKRCRRRSHVVRRRRHDRAAASREADESLGPFIAGAADGDAKKKLLPPARVLFFFCHSSQLCPSLLAR